MDLPNKTVAICARKKADYYCQKNDRSGKSLPVELDE